MATVEIAGLTARYGKKVALNELDLEVGDGEFLVVLGPSGAGKTTTLKSVAGLVDAVDGEVRIDGRSMKGVEPYHRKVAMAFESYALYPQKTVAQNLASPLLSGRSGTYSGDERQQRIDDVTSTLGIKHLQQRFPRELSNGQRQRVALGRVLVRPADVYLLDEPLSHLDAKLRAAMRAELKQLGSMSSTTTIYVTHDYQEALALGDRVAVLREGRLVQVGTPQQVWNEPADTFVARALGQPEMNLLPAVVADGRVRSRGGALELPMPIVADLSGTDEVVVGVRPRDIQVGERPGAALSVRGVVTLAERLGRAVELSVRVEGHADIETLIVVTDGRQVEEGETVHLHAEAADVHLFAAPGHEGAGRRLGSWAGTRTDMAAR